MLTTSIILLVGALGLLAVGFLKDQRALYIAVFLLIVVDLLARLPK